MLPGLEAESTSVDLVLFEIPGFQVFQDFGAALDELLQDHGEQQVRVDAVERFCGGPRDLLDFFLEPRVELGLLLGAEEEERGGGEALRVGPGQESGAVAEVFDGVFLAEQHLEDPYEVLLREYVVFVDGGVLEGPGQRGSADDVGELGEEVGSRPDARVELERRDEREHFFLCVSAGTVFLGQRGVRS